MAVMQVPWLLFVMSFVVASGRADLTLPPDIPFEGGMSVHAVCGSCCQGNMFCGAVQNSTTLHDSWGSTVTVPEGSRMTCMLRKRSVFGAVDGGLCLPSSLPAAFDFKNTCRLLAQVRWCGFCSERLL